MAAAGGDPPPRTQLHPGGPLSGASRERGSRSGGVLPLRHLRPGRRGGHRARRGAAAPARQPMAPAALRLPLRRRRLPAADWPQRGRHTRSAPAASRRHHRQPAAANRARRRAGPSRTGSALPTPSLSPQHRPLHAPRPRPHGRCSLPSPVPAAMLGLELPRERRSAHAQKPLRCV